MKLKVSNKMKLKSSHKAVARPWTDIYYEDSTTVTRVRFFDPLFGYCIILWKGDNRGSNLYGCDVKQFNFFTI